MGSPTGRDDTIGVDFVAPVTIELADIPAREYPGDSQLDRFLRGEITLERKKRLLSAERMAELQEAAMRFADDPNVHQMQSGPGLRAPVAGASFDSLDFNDCCGGGGNVPPDPELAVGLSHVIAVVNVAFEIYDKSGTSLVGPITLSSFFSALGGSSCTAGGPFDPNVLYDEEADRYMIAADGAGNAYCVGVSATGDPLGAWHLYQFPTNVGGAFFDYPHAGIGRDAIYMGANMFNPGFVEARVWAFDKVAMYAGAPATMVTRSTGGDSTPQPINLHGFLQGTWPTSGPHYILTDRNFNGQTVALHAWTDPFGANTFVTLNVLNLPAFHGGTVGFPVNVTQSGGGTIQANDFRVLDFEYRNGRGWTAMTVSCNPGGGTTNCVQWAEIDLDSATLVQAGVFASNGDHRFFPDVAANHCGDMAVGYTKSSASMFPSVWVSGRESGDPLGTLQAEVEVKAGEINYVAFDGAPRRWGDYSGMTIDPDGLTFWYLGEYSKITGNPSGRWGNYIGSFTFPDCFVAVPEIVLTTTVGTEDGVCASTDVVEVDAGTNVTFCYLVENTGPVTLNMHSLADTALGALVSDFPFSLDPGMAVFTTAATVAATTILNTATWTAFNADMSYTFDPSVPYDFIDISATGTPLNLTDDGEANVTMPFTFTFYGTTSNLVRIGNNGGILFATTTGDVAFTNTALPNAAHPLTIFPFWDDLDEETGNVYHQTLGTAPDRVFVVQWHERPHFPGSIISEHVTFQALLFEGSGEILFQYADVDFGDPALNGGASATVGLNKNDTTAVQFSFNSAALSDGMAILWRPTGFAASSDSARVVIPYVFADGFE
ncbi:MAG TPA: hypothetical protein PKZ76_00215 [Xanthomonadaceae bacterium]|nr:hypothetical protein [Xanthomonadaceae bacterium]